MNWQGVVTRLKYPSAANTGIPLTPHLFCFFDSARFSSSIFLARRRCGRTLALGSVAVIRASSSAYLPWNQDFRYACARAARQRISASLYFSELDVFHNDGSYTCAAPGVGCDHLCCTCIGPMELHTRASCMDVSDAVRLDRMPLQLTCNTRHGAHSLGVPSYFLVAAALPADGLGLGVRLWLARVACGHTIRSPRQSWVWACPKIASFEVQQRWHVHSVFVQRPPAVHQRRLRQWYQSKNNPFPRYTHICANYPGPMYHQIAPANVLGFRSWQCL